MSQRATIINLRDTYVIIKGEPILDTDEGVLIVAFGDGTSRVFNWDFVVDYYCMTEDEYRELLELDEQL